MNAACTVTVLVPGTPAARVLAVGESVVFGRDPGADLAFPESATLSWRAGEVVCHDSGAVIRNLSGRHKLFVETGGVTLPLPPSGPDGEGPGWWLPSGEAHVRSSDRRDDRFHLVVRVAGAPDARPGVADVSRTPRRSTDRPLRLGPHTKEFATALLLCETRLRGGPGASAPPSVAALTERILRATHSLAELRAFTADPEVRRRLVKQVEDHLKALRAKAVAAGLVEGDDAGIPMATLAAVLADSDVVTRRDLLRLGDRDWLAAQAERWWGREPGQPRVRG